MAHKISHVPVFVDNADYSEDLKMTRLTYFYVGCEEPHATTYAEGENALPTLLTELEGVIVAGLGKKKLLDTPGAIKELFDFIEDKTPYVVNTSYIWLPNELLKSCIKKKLARGDVLRVSTSVFLKACEHARTPKRITLEKVPSRARPVYFSEKETIAFKKWTDQTVERVKKRYRERPEKNLRNR